MTEPVIEVNGILETAKKTGRNGIYKKGKGSDWHLLAREHDSVDISDEARRRAAEEKQGEEHESDSEEENV
jgi:hypothetical protein